jgi:tRNA G18 (ribose-2'-O)-methylase SpoU
LLEGVLRHLNKYNRFAATSNAIMKGVNYFCEMRKRTMQELGRKSVEEFRGSQKFPIIIILENIRSAYNVGSVFRSSDAFFVEAIFICGYSARPPHKEIRKTALGAEESVSWQHFKSSHEAIREAKRLGYRVVAVEQAENSLPLQEMQWREEEKIAVVFGNEVTGIEPSTLQLCDGCIEIPQLGMKHSLNIATAAGVVLWELVREKMRSEN